MDVKSLSPACVTPVGNASLCARRPLLRNEYLKGKRLTKCSSVVPCKEQRRKNLAVTCSSSQNTQVGADEASTFRNCFLGFLHLSIRSPRADTYGLGHMKAALDVSSTCSFIRLCQVFCKHMKHLQRLSLAAESLSDGERAGWTLQGLGGHPDTHTVRWSCSVPASSSVPWVSCGLKGSW